MCGRLIAHDTDSPDDNPDVIVCNANEGDQVHSIMFTPEFFRERLKILNFNGSKLPRHQS